MINGPAQQIKEGDSVRLLVPFMHDGVCVPRGTICTVRHVMEGFVSVMTHDRRILLAKPAEIQSA